MFIKLFRLNQSRELVHCSFPGWTTFILSTLTVPSHKMIKQSYNFSSTELRGWAGRKSCLSQHFSQKNHTENCTLTQQLSDNALQRWRSSDFHFEKAAVKISQALAECRRGRVKIVQVEINRDTKYHQEQHLAISTKTQANFCMSKVRSTSPIDGNIAYTFIDKNIHKDSCANVTLAINKHPEYC